MYVRDKRNAYIFEYCFTSSALQFFPLLSVHSFTSTLLSKYFGNHPWTSTPLKIAGSLSNMNSPSSIHPSFVLFSHFFWVWVFFFGFLACGCVSLTCMTNKIGFLPAKCSTRLYGKPSLAMIPSVRKLAQARGLINIIGSWLQNFVRSSMEPS